MKSECSIHASKPMSRKFSNEGENYLAFHFRVCIIGTMKTTFNDTERRFLYELGVPRGMVYLWERGNPIGKRYARQVAKVKGVTVEEVLYPPDDKGDESMAG